ncbi:MAG TPA: hypothetical protein PLB53_08355 [Candidatus Atribacteria bacterium]|nr:hypothetical protein [Candidatus Atribacteria bacterium]
MKLLRKKEHLPQPRDDGLKNCYFCLSLQQPLLIHHPGDFRAVFSLPLNASIASYSSPRQSLSRGPQSTVFKIKRKNVDSRLKISGMTEGDGCLIKDFRHDG